MGRWTIIKEELILDQHTMERCPWGPSHMQIIVFRQRKIGCKWMAIKRCTKWYGEGGLIDSPIHSPCHTEIPFNKKQKPTKTSKRIVNGGKHTRDIKHFVVILYSTEREGVLPHTCHWTILCGWLPVKRQLPDVPHHWWQHLCLLVPCN